MLDLVWKKCVSSLQDELPQQQFATWIRPLYVNFEASKGGRLCLLAPNRFVMDWVSNKYLARIKELAQENSPGKYIDVELNAAPRPELAFQLGAKPPITNTLVIDKPAFAAIPPPFYCAIFFFKGYGGSGGRGRYKTSKLY